MSDAWESSRFDADADPVVGEPEETIVWASIIDDTDDPLDDDY